MLTTLIKKELTLELRNKAAISSILVYVVATIFVAFLSFKQVQPVVWNALFWIIMLFTAMLGVGKSFMNESPALQLNMYFLAKPSHVILSKIIHNSLIMLGVGIASFFIYSVVFGNPIQNFGMYLAGVAVGCVGFAGIFTMISAIASRSGNNLSLMSILSFPLVIPFILILIKYSNNCMGGVPWENSIGELAALLLMIFINVLVSVVLFPYLWHE